MKSHVTVITVNQQLFRDLAEMNWFTATNFHDQAISTFFLLQLYSKYWSAARNIVTMRQSRSSRKYLHANRSWCTVIHLFYSTAPPFIEFILICFCITVCTTWHWRFDVDKEVEEVDKEKPKQQGKSAAQPVIENVINSTGEGNKKKGPFDKGNKIKIPLIRAIKERVL